MLTLSKINDSLLFEWWAQDVAKSMKKKGTVGAFTQQCKDMGFNKSSLACIKHVEKEYQKAKKLFADGKMNKKEYEEWALKKKRATLAKTFKKWGSKKKKENKMKLRELLEEKLQKGMDAAFFKNNSFWEDLKLSLFFGDAGTLFELKKTNGIKRITKKGYSEKEAEIIRNTIVDEFKKLIKKYGIKPNKSRLHFIGYKDPTTLFGKDDDYYDFVDELYKNVKNKLK